MRIVRGCPDSATADRSVVEGCLSTAAQAPILRVWCPPRQAAFGPRDRQASGYERATALAADRDYVPVERQVGGRAVLYDGRTTLAVLRGHPRNGDQDIEQRYTSMLAALETALTGDEHQYTRGEPDKTFCPGSCSLSLADPNGQPRAKVAGLAQRVTAKAAIVGGILIGANRDELADDIEEIYEALDIPFDPTTVGSIEREKVIAELSRDLERALTGSTPTTTVPHDAV